MGPADLRASGELEPILVSKPGIVGSNPAGGIYPAMAKITGQTVTSLVVCLARHDGERRSRA